MCGRKTLFSSSQTIKKQFNIRRKREETKLPEKVVMSRSFDKKRIPRYIAEKQPHISEEEKNNV